MIWERAPQAPRGVAAPGRLPVLLIHGWPGAPIEFLDLIPALVAAGHDVVVPSLPGFAFSDAPEPPLNVAGMAARLRALMRGARLRALRGPGRRLGVDHRRPDGVRRPGRGRRPCT